MQCLIIFRTVLDLAQGLILPKNPQEEFLKYQPNFWVWEIVFLWVKSTQLVSPNNVELNSYRIFKKNWWIQKIKSRSDIFLLVELSPGVETLLLPKIIFLSDSSLEFGEYKKDYIY